MEKTKKLNKNSSNKISNIITNTPDYNGIGVYCLIDTVNGKKYIGSSINVSKRIQQHERTFALKKCSSKLLNAINSGHHFDCEILEKIDYGVNQFYIFEREKYYIDLFETLNKGYNIAITTASSKAELLKSLESFKNNSKMREYILNIIRKRETLIFR